MSKRIKIAATEEQPERVRNDWKMMMSNLSARGIINTTPFFAFIALLCVLYITNNQRTIEAQRVLNAKHEELKELRWKYMDIKSQLMNAGMETEIIRKAAVRGIKPMMVPAYRIEIDSTERSGT